MSSTSLYIFDFRFVSHLSFMNFRTFYFLHSIENVTDLFSLSTLVFKPFFAFWISLSFNCYIESKKIIYNLETLQLFVSAWKKKKNKPYENKIFISANKGKHHFLGSTSFGMFSIYYCHANGIDPVPMGVSSLGSNFFHIFLEV